MLKSIQKAILGDDVFRDDPTVQKLQNFAANLFYKEAALLVPSGCMGNSCALMCHTQRGQELICSDECHIIQQERSFVSQIAQLQSRTISTEHTKGLLTPESIEKVIRKLDFITEPSTGLITLEQPTFTGLVYPLETLKQIYAVAQKYKIPLHIDGARVFHAAAALNCEVKDITQYCDSIQFCLSKGLCAPIGSMIVGKKDFIEKSILVRKLLGGGMRQAGILAAPGLIGLKYMRRFMKLDIQIAQKWLRSQQKQTEQESLEKLKLTWFISKFVNKEWIIHNQQDLWNKMEQKCLGKTEMGFLEL
ncbi:threonine aldolase, putative [Ichthyophthirius multifiliis]|uniref:Threonine aldolase, putative n=1 Tax=Ichthyophthirius multifiliis TaxID=5932 RepID=G0R5S5_ICHMU|nr:threonine aldolase, putative [Ichthyophthirius multifiliis]EGR27183.1 threonine aldolase, putative [Ichthyophthirius multifiliis]|eukprot:XP_004024067.1 threonine aldolase, putative [Ichthyophthirius multifiliis]